MKQIKVTMYISISITLLMINSLINAAKYITIILNNGTANLLSYHVIFNIYFFLNKKNPQTYIGTLYSHLCLACPSFYQVTGSFLRLKPKYGNMMRIITWLKSRTHTHEHLHTHSVRNATAQSYTCRYLQF